MRRAASGEELAERWLAAHGHRVLARQLTKRCVMWVDGAETVRREHTYVRRLETIAPRLRSFVAESRAWPHWQRFLDEDPARALRFVQALRTDRPLLREDLWHLAEASALTRLGKVAAARRATERSRALNPALHLG